MHYISPDAYAEMLDIVAEIELESLKNKLVQSNCFSIQLDKSVDKYNSLFGTIRFLDVDYSMSVGFVGECHNEQRGVEGMMTAFTERLASIGLSDIVVEKMVGLTTDGESAITGKKSGIWARMSQHLGRGLMTVWCVAHRSDLAFESIIATVSTSTLAGRSSCRCNIFSVI